MAVCCTAAGGRQAARAVGVRKLAGIYRAWCWCSDQFITSSWWQIPTLAVGTSNVPFAYCVADAPVAGECAWASVIVCIVNYAPDQTLAVEVFGSPRTS
jgi:hypothetical protein